MDATFLVSYVGSRELRNKKELNNYKYVILSLIYERDTLNDYVKYDLDSIEHSITYGAIIITIDQLYTFLQLIKGYKIDYVFTIVARGSTRSEWEREIKANVREYHISNNDSNIKLNHIINVNEFIKDRVSPFTRTRVGAEVWNRYKRFVEQRLSHVEYTDSGGRGGSNNRVYPNLENLTRDRNAKSDSDYLSDSEGSIIVGENNFSETNNDEFYTKNIKDEGEKDFHRTDQEVNEKLGPTAPTLSKFGSYNQKLTSNVHDYDDSSAAKDMRHERRTGGRGHRSNFAKSNSQSSKSDTSRWSEDKNSNDPFFLEGREVFRGKEDEEGLLEGTPSVRIQDMSNMQSTGVRFVGNNLHKRVQDTRDGHPGGDLLLEDDLEEIVAFENSEIQNSWSGKFEPILLRNRDKKRKIGSFKKLITIICCCYQTEIKRGKIEILNILTTEEKIWKSTTVKFDELK